MTTKVTPWGNSLGIRIPKHLAKELNLSPGSEVKISSRNRSISITLVKSGQKKLKRLLALISDENRHDIQVDDSPQGKEIW